MSLETQLTILPTLDVALLQEKANQAAMKGAIAAIEEYYSGYNSPFKKAIEEDLKNKSINFGLDLPDIIATINQSISAEIDKVANTAISKSFVPLVQRFLTREEKEIKFSKILKEFVEGATDEEKEDWESNFSVDVSKNSHGWLEVRIEDSKRNYRFTLHEEWSSKKTPNPKYQLLSLPYKDGAPNQKMVLFGENCKLEMPFMKDVLSDNFTSFLARLILGNSLVTMDTTEFDEDMFPRDECHCN